MENGDDIPKSQHHQFAGRVQFDREAPREGQIRLNLSRVTVEDSGNYRCDLAVSNKNIDKWAYKTSGKFFADIKCPFLQIIW